MNEAVYVCTGGCEAVISREQYDEGLVKCGADGCGHHGQPFEKRFKCAKCGQLYKEEESHTC